MKRIKITKNRVKTKLEISVQNVDIKHKKIMEIFYSKYNIFLQAFAKLKRFYDIWVCLIVEKTIFSIKKSVFFGLLTNSIFLLS